MLFTNLTRNFMMFTALFTLSISAMAMSFYETKALAEQGDVNAQYNLGVMYEYGDGVKKDYAKALDWYQKAADQNDARALHHVGTLYIKGLGVQQDFSAAEEWFGRACDRGSQDGCLTQTILNLGNYDN